MCIRDSSRAASHRRAFASPQTDHRHPHAMLLCYAPMLCAYVMILRYDPTLCVYAVSVTDLRSLLALAPSFSLPRSLSETELRRAQGARTR
eukprot:2759700-Rhodomonas_salina.1